jgi:hypothetical protein
MEFAIAARFRSLPFERVHLRRNFFQDIGNPSEVLARGFEFRLSKALARFEFRYPGSLLENRSAVGRL